MSTWKFMHKVQATITDGGKRTMERDSYVLYVPGRGAIEAHRRKSPAGGEWTDTGYFGGIEVHSKTEREHWVYLPECATLGGKCWTDGSSMAFDTIEHHFDNPLYIKLVLDGWAERSFGIARPSKEENGGR